MTRFVFPRWEELPDIDLYMDQLLTYLTERLSCLYFADEKFVTNSMINNYVKAGLVHRPIRKHYTRKHIAYFLVVTILKRCYSMSQIDEMIQIQTHMKNSSFSIAYDLFITRFEESLNAVFDTDTDEDPPFQITRDEQLLMDHVIQCIIHKIHTEYLLSQTDHHKLNIQE
ncbi:MAG: DUF1836 domain-containing protein [Bulleidia sp.]